jgi:hypothetical protein
VLQEVTESGEITLLAGYAPSKEATKVLGLEVGIKTNAVASLLLSKQTGEPKPNQLWIVDEAGMLRGCLKSFAGSDFMLIASP